MIMNKLYRIVSAFALVIVVVSSKAQVVSPVDFMRMNPYQMMANPATDLPYESVMSLVIGNIGLDVQNTTLRYDNFFDFDAQGRPVTLNLRQLANSLKADNFLGLNAPQPESSVQKSTSLNTTVPSESIDKISNSLQSYSGSSRYM